MLFCQWSSKERVILPCTLIMARNKKSVCYKLLTKRVNSYLERVHPIVRKQHMFQKERSTETACRILTADIKRTSPMLHNLLYTLFIDFTAALCIVLDKAVRTLTNMNVTINVFWFLARSYRRTLEPPLFTQTAGQAQEDNLTPLLFSIALKGLFSQTKRAEKTNRGHLV